MNKSKRKLYVISNMYPSKQKFRYGVFVKNFVHTLEDHFQIETIVLTKKKGMQKLWGYFVLYLRISSLLFKAKKEDIIYVHYPLHVAPILFLLNKKYVLNFHGSDLIFNSSFKRFLGIFQKRIIKKAHLVFPSTYFKEFFLKDFLKEEEKMLVYPSGGIDRGIFKVDKKLDSKTFVLGFISNFIPKKGWKIYLDAIEILHKQQAIPEMAIYMVGDGPDTDQIKARLENMEVPFTLRSNLNHAQLAEVYNSFNLMIFPTYRKDESLGLVGLESMSCGIPVVASNMAGPKGYINHQENGYLFETKNVEDLCSKILQYYRLSPEEKENMIRKAIATSCEFDSEFVKGNLITFLNNIPA